MGFRIQEWHSSTGRERMYIILTQFFFGYLQTTEQEMRKIQLTLTIKNT